MKTIITQVLRTVIAEAKSCSIGGLSPNMASRVRVQQINSLSIVIMMMSVTGLGTMMLTLYEYWGAESTRLLAVFAIYITVCYGVLFQMSLLWVLTKCPAAGDVHRTLRLYTLVCSALGSAWGLLIVVLMQHSRPEARCLLYGIIIGLMSAPAMVTPCSAAFAFWIPISVGGIVSIALLSAARDLGGTVLMTGYTSLTLFCLLYLNKALIRRVVAEVEQSAARGTIDLLLRDFEDSARDWLWETDVQGNLTHVSNRFAEAAGVSIETLLGTNLLALLGHTEPSEQVKGEDTEERVGIPMARHKAFQDLEIWTVIKGRRLCWCLTGKPKFSPLNAFEGFRGVGSDITARKLAVERAATLASYDELTGLANRRYFREILTRRLEVTRDRRTTLMCMDLDGFKIINDRYGHPVGDVLLRMVSLRLQSLVRSVDLCGRLGGDEFAVILDDLSSVLSTAMAEHLVKELSRPYFTEQCSLEIGVSIGLAITTVGHCHIEDLLRDADAALYEAKSQGRKAWCLYDESLSARILRQRVLQNELRCAIAAGDLRVDFQPIFSLGSGHLSSIEALVRWTRPQGEVVSPSEFIPLAESGGLIGELGAWVLEHACKAATSLPGAVKVAVNVSPVQLRDREILGCIQQILTQTGLDPRRLELEVTETAFLDMGQPTLDLLDEIRALGVGINLDDFGVGQTSLSQLRRYPFSTLKIDQSFIRDMPTSKASRAIVRGVASMAKELGIKTTAEGIESEEHLCLVRDVGCEQAQGFLLGRPTTLTRLLQTFPSDKQLCTTEYASSLKG